MRRIVVSLLLLFLGLGLSAKEEGENRPVIKQV